MSAFWALALLLAMLLTLHVAGPAPAAERAATQFTVTNRVPSEVTVGERVTIAGKVTTDGEHPRVVLLERSTILGFLPVAATRSTAAGWWRLRVPTSWYHQARLRVRAPADARHASAVRGPYTLRVKPDYKPAGRSSSWTHLNGIRARWAACEAISYRVNPNGQRGAVDLVRRALRLVHQASGLRFRYLGTTSAIPFNRVGRKVRHGDEGLTVAWATPRQVSQLRGGVAGYGGFSYADDDIFLGHVALDATHRLPMRFGPGSTSGALVLHELGHAMGLGHVSSQAQRMFGSIGSNSTGRYGAGDIAGLRAKGVAPQPPCTDQIQDTARRRMPALSTVGAH